MKTAIYGIGNIPMGDDGVGPAVVRYLSSLSVSCAAKARVPKPPAI